MYKIPSKKDFARADRLDRERHRNLDRVWRKVERYCKKFSQFYRFAIMPQGDPDFRAYVFFKKNKDIEACKGSGIVQDIIDCVYAELERAGRGKKEDITVAFEFDSDENVIANFEGNYGDRLH